MKAIILAAGVGSRIKKFSLKKHKSLIKIGNKSLLTRIVDHLIDINIKDILIVTGHKSELIKREIKTKAKYIYFPGYRSSNNLQTLLYVKNQIKGPFLCLFSDIFFDKKILLNLKKSSKDICLAVDTSKVLKDTMRIKIKNKSLIDIGSQIKVSDGDGNFIGISKFSKKGAINLKKSLKFYQNNYTDYYTLALKRLIKKRNRISYFDVKSLYWTEIDFYKDYLKLKKKYVGK